jgi:hypothetical protein
MVRVLAKILHELPLPTSAAGAGGSDGGGLVCSQCEMLMSSAVSTR